jgi:hypothetical protein
MARILVSKQYSSYFKELKKREFSTDDCLLAASVLPSQRTLFFSALNLSSLKRKEKKAKLSLSKFGCV